MAVITFKECGELIYLTPHGFWNITDFGAIYWLKKIRKVQNPYTCRDLIPQK
jgi:hypothetical protein